MANMKTIWKVFSLDVVDFDIGTEFLEILVTETDQYNISEKEFDTEEEAIVALSESGTKGRFEIRRIFILDDEVV